MKFICVLFLSCFFIVAGNLKSQNSCPLVPMKNYRNTDTVMAEIISNQKKEADKIILDKKIKIELTKNLKEQWNWLKEMDTDGNFMYDDTITVYLNKILQNIVAYNPLLKGKSYKIVTQRDIVPNAYSYGTGLILFHLGMIPKMRTEAEVANVICHELGHDYFEHSTTSSLERMKLYGSAEYKKAMRISEQGSYNKKQRKENAMKFFLAREMHSSRTNELRADSIGLFFLKNAGYNPYEAINQLNSLDLADYSAFKTILPYEKLFRFSSVPFKKEWLSPKDSSIDLGSNLEMFVLPDSLKSHPDCPERAVELKKIIEKNNFRNEGKTGSDQFNFIKDLANKEELVLLEKNKEFGLGLYHTLNLYLEDSSCNYTRISIVNFLYEIYASRKEHYSTEVLKLPSKKNNFAYNQFLVFAGNLNSAVTGNYTKEFYNKFSKTFVRDVNYDYVTFLANSIGWTKKQTEDAVSQMAIEKKNPDLVKKLKARFGLK